MLIDPYGQRDDEVHGCLVRGPEDGVVRHICLGFGWAYCDHSLHEALARVLTKCRGHATLSWPLAECGV